MATTETAGKTLSGSASGEEVFRLLFRRHPIPMWIYDVETLNFLDLNDAAVEKYGYDREQFLKMTIKDIRPTEDVAGLLNDVAKIQSELSRSGELRHALKGGRTIDVEITSRTLEYNGRKAALLIAQDITERKQSERIIQDSEKRFKAIFDQSPVAIALLDMEGHPIVSNLPLSKMLGYSKDELSKMKFTDFTYPDDVDKDLGQFTALIEGKISGYNLEKRFVHKNGHPVWVSLSVTILRDENGVPQDIIGMAEEITERKNSEETLAASEIRYRRLFEAAKDGILILDAETGMIVDANPFLIKLLSYSREQLIGKSVWELGFLKDKIANHENFLELKQKGYVRYEDMPLETSDGRRIDVEFVSNVYKVNHQSVIQCNIRDITERKHAADAIRETEERFRLVFENVFDGISIYSEDHDPSKRRLIECNQRYAEMSGRSHEELITLGNTLGIQTTPKDSANVDRLNALSKRTAYHGSFSWIRPDGKENTVEYVSTPIMWRGKSYSIGIDRDVTERNRMVKNLRESEKRYRGMFENMHDVYYESSMEGAILEISPSIKQLSKGQYQRDDLIGGSMYDFYADPKERLTLLSILEAKGRVTDFEMILKNRDGTHVPCSISATVRFDDQQRPEMIIGNLRDVTERRKSEESRLLIMTALESTANGVSITDVKGNFVWVNKAFCDMTGYASKETLGKTPRILKSGKQDDVFNKRIWDTILAGKVWKGELINKKKNNTLYDDELTITPLKNRDGEITNFIAIEQDITERKKLEKDLLFATEIAKLGYWEYDVDSGNFTFSDQYFRLIHGSSTEKQGGNIMSAEEFAKKLVYPADAKLVGEGLVKAIESEDPNYSINQEARVYRENGDLTTVNVMFKGVKDQSGRTYKVYGANQDVTEHKTEEKAKRNLEGQLQQAQKLESIGTLASGIAHDFNNILGIILGHSSLLERVREKPDLYGESVAAIMKASQRGALLVKQLMLFARKTEPLLESVNVNVIIAEITKLLQETFPKTITFSMSLQRDLPMIVADSSQIHQVLINLFVNARDAMPMNGAISISTSTIPGDAVSPQFHKATARRYIEIEVTDTGAGMDDSTRQKIFEPFFTTKAPGKGTGLGLAVVFGIVTRHNGFIDVRSEPGKGTSFFLYFPIPERTSPEDQTVKKNSDEKMAGGTETILLIEDEEVLRKLAQNILISKGYKVLTAGDGIEGVEAYRSHRKEIAVVLSDIGLPLLDGQGVFRKIRRINPDAKIIFASGFFDPEARSEMFKAGLTNFIQKPYMQDEVLQKIREAIDAK